MTDFVKKFQQVRSHKKKRINKKWAKRYGMVDLWYDEGKLVDKRYYPYNPTGYYRLSTSAPYYKGKIFLNLINLDIEERYFNLKNSICYTNNSHNIVDFPKFL
jgi:hypothetical protein